MYQNKTPVKKTYKLTCNVALLGFEFSAKQRQKLESHGVRTQCITGKINREYA